MSEAISLVLSDRQLAKNKFSGVLADMILSIADKNVIVLEPVVNELFKDDFYLSSFPKPMIEISQKLYDTFARRLTSLTHSNALDEHAHDELDSINNMILDLMKVLLFLNHRIVN